MDDMSTFSPMRVAEIFLTDMDTFDTFAPMLTDDMLAEVMSAVETLTIAGERKVIRSKVRPDVTDTDVDALHVAMREVRAHVMGAVPVVARHETLKDGSQGALKARTQSVTINGADGVKVTVSVSLPVK
jgi:hypothetical protein